MCQPRSEGGRRCPIHRHDSVAYIQLAEKDTGLNKRQVENIFRELSREGRHTEDPTEAQWRTIITEFQTSLNERTGHRNIKSNLAKAFDNFTVPDGKTYYALQKLKENTENKAEKLNDLFSQIAMEKGMPVANVKRRFNRYSNAVDISRGAGTPEDYSQRAYLFAKNNNLPYDKSSVVAIEQLRNIPVQRDDVHRVTMNPVNIPASDITGIGYNAEGGRVELTLRNSGDRIFAYHNVPDETWNEVYNNGTINHLKLRTLMSNEDYKYANENEEAQDRYNIHCESCGQFASPVSHTCPERVAQEETPALTPVEQEREAYAGEQTEQEEQSSIYRNEYMQALMEENLRSEEAVAIEEARALSPEAQEIVEIPEPVVEPIVDPNAYNPTEPVRTNQVEGAIIQEFIDRNTIELDREQFNGREYRYSYSVQQNNANLRIYENSSDGVVDFNGFEDELRQDLENRSRINIVLQTLTTYSPYQDTFKVLMINSEGRFLDSARRSTTLNIQKVHDDVKTYDSSISFTDEELRAASNEISLASNNHVLDNRATYTQTIKYDAALVTQPKLRIPKITDLRKAMRDHNVFYAPIVMDNDYATSLYRGRDLNGGHSAIQDDQGHLQVFSSYGYNNSNLTGHLKYEKQADGTFKAVAEPKLLKCQCINWRKNKYCEHVDNLLRRADNILQQSVKSNPTNRTRVDLSALPNARYLTAALSRREDLTITPPNEDDGTELNYTFTQFNTNDRSSRRLRRWFTDRATAITLTHKLDVEDQTSFEAFNKAKELSSLGRELRDISTIEDIKGLVKAGLGKKGTVTVPFKATYSKYYYGDANNVTGTVTYAKDTEGNMYVKGDNLQCDCSDYREDYRCKHVIVTSNHAQFINMNDEAIQNDRNNPQNLRSILNYETNENYELYSNMNEIYRSLTAEEKLNMPESEIRTRAADMVAERARMAAEEAAREAVRREARAIRDREMNRVRNERRARDLEASVDNWKQENPERAAALVAYRENMMNKWENVEPSYTNNPELAKEAIADALARKANGENPIEFRSEGVLDGMSDGPAGRKFGIELEFDIQGANRNAALRKIGQELHEAGLTTSPEQMRYHSAARNGYATWSFEQDCTVDAELVSPILDDSPESWEQVRIATEIITRNGGKATTRAGSHVHISTGTYENSSAKRAELLRFNREHQDMVYRLASDPKRGTHRGWSWCAPNVDDHGGEINDTENASTYLFSGDHGSHNVGLNLSAMQTNLTSSNVEFRMWDATLDAGTIQAQVMLSAAMTDYAERTVIKEKKTLVRDSVSTIGSAASENKDRHDLTGNTGFASFVDKLFRKDEDKSQIASLFAVTNWQRSS